MTQATRNRFRIAIPGWRLRKSQTDPVQTRSTRIDEFREIFAADLKPFGSMDRRLTKNERRQSERSARVRESLKGN